MDLTEEEKHAMRLASLKWVEVHGTRMDKSLGVPGSFDKLRPIQDLQMASFFDCFVEIVKVFHRPMHPAAEIYVTDYTVNDQLLLYGPIIPEHHSWQGPWGRRTLKITTFDENLRLKAEALQCGQFLLIQNGFTRMNQLGFMEARVSGGFSASAKEWLKIQPNDQRLRELIKYLCETRISLTPD